MKKTFLSCVALGLLVASCDTSSKDSYQTIPYSEYNLIVDTQNPDQLAQVSYSEYQVKYNISKYTMDVKSSDIIINNQKYSFETDPMAINSTSFKTADNLTVEKTSFSQKGSAGVGSPVSDLNAYFAYCYVPASNDLLYPDLKLTYNQRLDINYTLSDRYRIQSFWPSAVFVGHSYAVEGSNTFTSKEGFYIVNLDFEKKTASVLVYRPEFSADQSKEFPQIISMDNAPINFTHDSFSVDAAAPNTKVLGKKDNSTALVESDEYKATDLSVTVTSSDLTEVVISYKFAGKTITFTGCSILKPGL